eukprot:1716181-Rhodomonas_salina.3
MVLSACYAMSGTERCYMLLPDMMSARSRARFRSATCLQKRYAMSSTDMAYAGTVASAVRYLCAAYGVYCYAATHALCEAQY